MIERRALGRSGVAVTSLGFGGGAIAKLAHDRAEEDSAATLEAAWDAGIRYFDTAPLYGLGRGEARLGRFLRRQRREDLVLSTKVGRLLTADGFAYDYSRNGTLRSLEASLVRLGLDRIDIALVHDIDRRTHGRRQKQRQTEALAGALPALLRLKEEGVVRAVGLGVNEWQVCRAVAERMPLDCLLLAGRYTLLEQEGAARELLPLCRSRGIGLIIGGPHNSGILATGSAGAGSYDYGPVPAPVRERVRALEAVLARHGIPLPAAALRFPLLEPAVAAVIPGLVTPAEVVAAFKGLAIPIPDKVWSDLREAGLLVKEAVTGP